MITKLKKFNVLGDERGQLIALEENKEIPFAMKRVFYIFGTNSDLPRGEHSHHKTKQFLIAINGSCKVTLDNGKEKETFDLYSRNVGLFQNALIWGTMHDFSEDCILMVLSDHIYDAKDYITDYNKFLKVIN